jgi:hypothetical protein
MQKILTAIAAAVMALTAQAAAAATSFNFSFSGLTQAGQTLSGMGVFLTGDGVASTASPGFTEYTINDASGSIQLDGIDYASIAGLFPDAGASNIIIGDGTAALLVDTAVQTSRGALVLTLNEDGSGSYLVAFEDLSAPAATVAVSEVPEPATWGMMLLGFAMVAAAVRRRRAAPAFA